MFTEDYYLTSITAKALYEKYAKDLPIIDYHCHLSPKEICEDLRFSNIAEMWLAHDHYKWRAMRAFGIDEELITGGAGWYDKFYAFAGIIPYLAGNPLYIWCALELKRYFGIDEPLSDKNAEKVYAITSDLIEKNNITPSYLIRQSNVEFIATTDDPADDLLFHKKISENGTYANCRIVPAFRPDKAMGPEKPGYPAYIETLGKVAGVEIKSFRDLMRALEERLKAFKAAGSMLNDNGLTGFIWSDYDEGQIDKIFSKAMNAGSGTMNNSSLTEDDLNKYRSAFLFETAALYSKYGFTAQYHTGAYRNANNVMYGRLGPDTGYDGVDDAVSVRAFGTLLDRLNSAGCLPRVIFYPLDINQYEAFAALAASFCGAENGAGGGGAESRSPGGGPKNRIPRRGWVQLGAPWWFNDQYYGIYRQFESAGNIYPAALSAGMLTDSRSFLSYPRHELYRRALCAYLGAIVDRGEYFSGEEALGNIIRDICYNNAKNYFNL